MIYEKKRIKMVLSTHFYQVTSTIETSDGSDATLAVGLTDFGAAKVETDAQKGMLSLVEKISEKDGSIGCAVFADSAKVKGFAQSGKDRLILLDVKSGEPVTYYVGAGWSQDTRFDPFASKWPRLIKGTTYNDLQVIYR
jgi:pectinesterase